MTVDNNGVDDTTDNCTALQLVIHSAPYQGRSRL
jgi:hypothetical protein